MNQTMDIQMQNRAVEQKMRDFNAKQDNAIQGGALGRTVGMGRIGSQEPQPALEIPSAMNSLGGDVDTLNEAAQELVRRLCGVLTPTQPEEAAKCGNTSQLRATNIGMQIDEIRGRVNYITRELQSALNRLAL